MKTLALIPCRSGSTRVPDKNIRLLNGLPLLSYPILTARKSKYVNRIVVSTDSVHYAALARAQGAETPFLRPKELAEDVPSELVAKHCLETLSRYEDYRPDVFVLMQCTTPLTSVEDLDGCIDLFKESGADTVLTVREVREHPDWMFYYHENTTMLFPHGHGNMKLEGDWGNSKKQRKLYIPTGGVYVGKPSVIIRGRIYGDDIRGYEVPFRRGWDVDEEYDFSVVTALMKEEK